MTQLGFPSDFSFSYELKVAIRKGQIGQPFQKAYDHLSSNTPGFKYAFDNIISGAYDQNLFGQKGSAVVAAAGNTEGRKFFGWIDEKESQ